MISFSITGSCRRTGARPPTGRVRIRNSTVAGGWPASPKARGERPSTWQASPRLAGEKASLGEGTKLLREERAALAGDNERLSRANKKLNAEKNNIKVPKTVPGTDRTSSGPPGRRPGCKPTINRRPSEIDREETVDVTVCPDGHRLSEVSDSYTMVVRITHVWH